MRREDLRAAFAQQFGRNDVTADHIKSLCTRSGWVTGRIRDWDDDADALLRELYPTTPTKDVARRLGRTIASTYGRARDLGLAKTEAYLASPAAGRLQVGAGIGAASRFKKGQTPPNKGLRRPGWNAGRMQDTQFKRGQHPRKWKPIGAERIAEGYRFTKISDERGVPWTKNWRQTHIIEWERRHGPLPIGTVLKCLDGDRLNVDAANWESVPRGVIARLAGKSGRDYDGAPAELKPTILAVAKLEHALAGLTEGATP